MKLKIWQLGTMVKDIVTATTGMLTHIVIDMAGGVKYIYQPRGINPTTKKPIDAIWIEANRISKGIEVEVDLPTEILGKEAEDVASRFKGIAICLIHHINGCNHVEIKASGLNKDGNTIDSCEFDIRRIKSEVIPRLNRKELEKSKKETPSPIKLPKKK